MSSANKKLNAEDIKYIVAHCSAGNRAQKAEDVVAFHKTRWPSQEGMSYAYFIEEDGTVRDGRPELSLGFHVGNLNSVSIGFCAAGGVDTKGVRNGQLPVLNNFTDEQHKSIAMVAATLLAKYPKAKLIGHNEVCTKACPVYDVHAIMRDNMRETEKDTEVLKLISAPQNMTDADGSMYFWKTVRYFNSSEFEIAMDRVLVCRLDDARHIYGRPMVVRDAPSPTSCNIRARTHEEAKLLERNCRACGLNAKVLNGVLYVELPRLANNSKAQGEINA